ncbi:type II toxin-antitoxin system mRNA interferase toxin, RelE/StbE family [Candidatus Peregrinibacteria bacterium]|nr:type II toxin-antitoxin system mRNA interferase toxin, RelE/StbE family [Candidatus Peregrinibacteria bacterium]
MGRTCLNKLRMKIVQIKRSKTFLKQIVKLSKQDQKITAKKVDLLICNPGHPSLRIHSLKGNLSGCWSISINRSLRIIFTLSNEGVAIFHSIGTHAIYE